jgi:poly-gamma-glutamate synthesis protein (capsule biosynthesis protein)
MAREAARPAPRGDSGEGLRLFLAGDVMTGRGIDQVLPHPGDPKLFEGHMRSALGYVELAERASGPVSRPVAFEYPWGVLLDELARRRPARRIVNLETAVTTASEAEPKGINYRMHPDNLPVLRAAGIDACVLANNHVLDWGRAGLDETLRSLGRAGIACAGAGRTAPEAVAPAALPLAGGGRLLLLAFASGTSGVPRHWAAGEAKCGLSLLPESPGEAVAAARGALDAAGAAPGDLVVISIHWGGNWGQSVPSWQRDLAHGLIEQAGADIVHGHSAHHPKAVERHAGRLILYGCGDLLNDYEGIGGYEAHRPALGLAFFADLAAADGALRALEMVPLRRRRFRLERAAGEDAAWLADTLDRVSRPFGSGVALGPDGVLRLAGA